MAARGETDRNGWVVERTTGPAGAFHHRPPPVPLRPTVWVHRVERPALVLGSTQRSPLLDEDAAARHGIEVCQRRSGGGLVYVDPDHSCWIDVVVPRGHTMWSDDVSLAFDWVGQTWASAVRALLAGPAGATTGVDRVTVHRGPLLHADWGRVVCFAGLGPGEVLVNGRKVVGLSQRRTREAARFQGLAVTALGADAIRRHLVAGALPTDLDEALDDLPVGTAIDLDQLTEGFLDQLPDA